MPWAYKQPSNWKTTRRRILERDGYRCCVCGGPATQVDAIVPESQGGTHTDDANLAAICDAHHAAKSKAEASAARHRYVRTRPRESHPGMGG